MSQSEIQVLPEGFLIGADPELFVFGADGPVSAHDLILGTKANPHPVPGGAIQVDGTAAEFNINPAASFEEFNANIETVLASLQSYLPERLWLESKSVVVWPEDYFAGLPYEAKELGCMPDFDAWTGKRNPKPSLKSSPTLRTAAGHIHIGWTKDAEMTVEHVLAAREMVKLMDWHVGAWSCSIDPDKIRRSLYGKAGACRYKSYGVEYRTLSNFWVLDADLRLAVWNRTVDACAEFATGEYRKWTREDMATVTSYINGAPEGV